MVPVLRRLVRFAAANFAGRRWELFRQRLLLKLQHAISGSLPRKLGGLMSKFILSSFKLHILDTNSSGGAVLEKIGVPHAWFDILPRSVNSPQEDLILPDLNSGVIRSNTATSNTATQTQRSPYLSQRQTLKSSNNQNTPPLTRCWFILDDFLYVLVTNSRISQVFCFFTTACSFVSSCFIWVDSKVDRSNLLMRSKVDLGNLWMPKGVLRLLWMDVVSVLGKRN